MPTIIIGKWFEPKNIKRGVYYFFKDKKTGEVQVGIWTQYRTRLDIDEDIVLFINSKKLGWCFIGDIEKYYDIVGEVDQMIFN